VLRAARLYPRSAQQRCCTPLQLLICAYTSPFCLQITDQQRKLLLNPSRLYNKAFLQTLCGQITTFDCCSKADCENSRNITMLPLRCTTQNYDWGVPASQDIKVRV
jgi:hypothetical protein